MPHEARRSCRSIIAMLLRATSIVSILATADAAAQRPAVRCGADVLIRDSLTLLDGLRIAVVCNRSSVLSDGEHILGALQRPGGPVIAAIFTPEHGLQASAPAGNPLGDSVYQGIPVYSLYGRERKPAPHQLRGVDLLLFDLQDVGTRFYTYVSTMILCMEAAAEAGISFRVLDRPNPINGLSVEGPLLAADETNFVGMLPVPVRHGMTTGELARMAVGERWLRGAKRLDLRVSRMMHWQRSRWHDETGLSWIPPSPNIPDAATALAYPATCLLEGTNISEGRGTDTPFLVFGAPFLRTAELLERLRRVRLPGVRFEPADFTPRSLPGAPHPKYEGIFCRGLRMRVTNRASFKPVRTGLLLLAALRATHGTAFTTTAHLDKLLGTRNVVSFLRPDAVPERVIDAWNRGVREFRKSRSTYLLY